MELHERFDHPDGPDPEVGGIRFTYPPMAVGAGDAFHDAALPGRSCDAEPKFALGHTVITAAAAAVLPDHEVRAALARHVLGDWGALGAEDWASNDRALVEGTRLLSAYCSQGGIRFWIISEWDRSITTVLLPEDY
jgi:hypothetical protein